jgi:transposase-like protein
LKAIEQQAARHLRTHGRSVKEIAATLDVAKSTASRWVRHVELTPEARLRLAERIRLGPIVAAERKAERARAVRLGYQRKGRELARRGEDSYIAGCMLYWAEGSKARGKVEFVNSDPAMLAYFLGFLRRYFDVANDKVTIYCNLFADHVERQSEIEGYWLAELKLDRSSLRKSHVNVYSKYSQKKRAGKLPYGTCTLRVHSTRIVQTIYGSIQEYGGFDRPAWLD